jgi:hypothetical protein
MLLKVRRFLNMIGASLADHYNRPPGCCAAGGLTRSQLEGRPMRADKASRPLK